MDNIDLPAQPRARWRRSADALMQRLAPGRTPADPLNFLARRNAPDVAASIAYGDGARRTLDVYRGRGASAAPAAPVVVFFYGGEWQRGDKEMYFFLAAALAARGCVAIVPDYRVYPEVRFPDFLADGATAIAWTKRNAPRFGGDPERIYLMGHSAGAHIAAMLALDPQWLAKARLDPRRDLAGLIGLAGPYDFLPLRDPILKTIFAVPDLAATQPISFVRGGEPPAFLATGRTDQTVDPGNSARLAAKLRAHGSRVTEIRYPRLGHRTIIGAFAPVLRFLAPVVADVDAFIARTGAPARIPAVAPRVASGR